jgi:hypothetical protein
MSDIHFPFTIVKIHIVANKTNVKIIYHKENSVRKPEFNKTLAIIVATFSAQKKQPNPIIIIDVPSGFTPTECYVLPTLRTLCKIDL